MESLRRSVRKGNGWERTVPGHWFEWRRERADGESRFHTLKSERVPHTRYTSRDEARRNLFADIETDDNRRRLHAALGQPSRSACPGSGLSVASGML